MVKWIGGKPWFELRELIDLFVAMGCEPRECPTDEVEPHGSWTIRFLYNPLCDRFVSLDGYAMNQHIAPSVLASWERTLQLAVPKGKPH